MCYLPRLQQTKELLARQILIEGLQHRKDPKHHGPSTPSSHAKATVPNEGDPEKVKATTAISAKPLPAQSTPSRKLEDTEKIEPATKRVKVRQLATDILPEHSKKSNK